MNYWFLYTIATGAIYGAPYLGHADEWTNIPAGCAVLGPFPQDEAPQIVKDAYANPRDYRVENENFIHVPYVLSVAERRQAVVVPWESKIEDQRQLLRRMQDEDKPAAAITKAKTDLKTMIASKNTEIAGVK